MDTHVPQQPLDLRRVLLPFVLCVVMLGTGDIQTVAHISAQYFCAVTLRVVTLPGTCRRNKINIHVGGTYGDKKATLERFAHVVNHRLSPNCRYSAVRRAGEGMDTCTAGQSCPGWVVYRC